jgi:CRP-like cAMP-binding protein
MVDDALGRSLRSLAPLSTRALARLEAITTSRSVAKGARLLAAGEVATTVFFVEHGLLREYYVDDRGREFTRTFSPEGEVTGSLADLLSGAPSMVNIEALEPSVLRCFPFTGLQQLTAKDPQWERLLLRFTERLFVRKMRREFEMLTLGAAERHRRFVDEFRALDARLPRHLVASYLGITPVHLSRLRAARAKKH